MSDANKVQVGGSHYKTTFEHWDFVVKAQNNRYLEGQVSKYVTRWRKKNGLTDLQKARHFLVKLVEEAAAGRVAAMPLTLRVSVTVDAYCRDNELTTSERQVIEMVTVWRHVQELRNALEMVERMVALEEKRQQVIEAVKAGAVPVGYGNHEDPTQFYVKDGPDPGYPDKSYIDQDQKS